MTKALKALSLFSGGLDSILATRVIMEQGIAVEAIQFVTPFFNYDLLEDEEGHRKRVYEKFGIDVHLVDISDGYLQLLHNPVHGFGKNFNPCVDCKIMMLSKARAMLEERGASFLVTGEVLGQRPMSQRRDTLNIIERDSGTRGLLLRPLCAKLMTPTAAEEDGLVDREKLLAMSGRGRSAQIALAKQYGITDYPSPAGGCILADPILSRRIARLYGADTIFRRVELTARDVRTLLVGRQFQLPGGGWLVIGRDQRDNEKLEKLISPDDVTLFMENWPGPLAVLKKCAGANLDEDQFQQYLQLAAQMVVRYGKKPVDAERGEQVVSYWIFGQKQEIHAAPLADEEFCEWQVQ